MNDNIQFDKSGRWSAWEKIAFRFFFLFFTLQILTENFLGNLFGGALFVWRLGEDIFVPPCLWLNNHIFHFKYISQSWTTFSGSLHTVRDTVYILLACLGCTLWTIFDKNRPSYNKALYWFSWFAITVLSSISFAYGVIKLFPVQMAFPSFIDLQKPVGDLSPFELLWTTFGYGRPYQVFTGFFEITGAILILFNRTRAAGLLIIASVMLNVIMLNYTYQIGVLITSFYIFLLALFLLAPYARPLLQFFFTRQPVALFTNHYVPRQGVSSRILKAIAMVFIGSSFILNTSFAYRLYVKRKNTDGSRQYSLVRNYIVNNDTLRATENDSTCWRIWSERVTEGKRFVTITTMKPGSTQSYTIEQDSLKRHLTLHPLNQHDSTSLNFIYTRVNNNNWCLEGLVKQKNIRIELQKVSPDTLMNLLKTRRIIIPLDDESPNE